MYKSLFLKTLTLFVFLVLPFSVLHAESNSGFLNDTIWYSEKTFAEEVKTMY